MPRPENFDPFISIFWNITSTESNTGWLPWKHAQLGHHMDKGKTNHHNTDMENWNPLSLWHLCLKYRNGPQPLLPFMLQCHFIRDSSGITNLALPHHHSSKLQHATTVQIQISDFKLMGRCFSLLLYWSLPYNFYLTAIWEPAEGEQEQIIVAFSPSCIPQAPNS